MTQETILLRGDSQPVTRKARKPRQLTRLQYIVMVLLNTKPARFLLWYCDHSEEDRCLIRRNLLKKLDRAGHRFAIECAFALLFLAACAAAVVILTFCCQWILNHCTVIK